jgi:hypothetical protein
LKHDEALAYARLAAKAFGIDPDRKIEFGKGPDREVQFDKELAKKDVSGDDTGDGSKPLRKSKKAK